MDVDNLYVKTALANDGPRLKRIRPAPMGRALSLSAADSAYRDFGCRGGSAPGLVETAEPEAGRAFEESGDAENRQDQKGPARKAPTRKEWGPKSGAKAGRRRVRPKGGGEKA